MAAPAPNPTDFNDLAAAERWAARANDSRPWRDAMMRLIARTLHQRVGADARVFELGSGPGFLAERVLEEGRVQSYTALDASEAMHTLARRRLGAWLPLLRFVTRSFAEPGWTHGLGPFDAVVTLQAVHEVRDRGRIPDVLMWLHELLRPDGLLLYADLHVAADTPGRLHLTRAEQPLLLAQAGFHDVGPLLELDDAALFGARKG